MIETFANGRVRSWASILDDATRAQAELTATLPILAAPLALMPDAHLGKGAAIGTVLVTENAVIPMAVGVDIGCGMAARRLNLTHDELDDRGPGRWVEQCRELVPAGLGHWHTNASPAALDWLETHAPSNNVDEVGRAAAQLGTLGSGNHFVELSVDQNTEVWLLLHSGSRGVGNRLALLHTQAAVASHGADAPDRDLAWLDAGTAEFEDYLRDLLWAQAYALENRRLLLSQSHLALEIALGQDVEAADEVNCHHNYAQNEYVEELGRPLFVTRKGAIRARLEDRGLIPGAMGQVSFVVSGLGNALSYESCSHGAGRVMSRTRARKELTAASLTERMAGVAWLDRHAQALLDEHPASYKPVEQVMADQADLVRVDYTLKAIANYKGVEREGARVKAT
jgi:tRNA-splicing ligase RtcB